MNNAEVDLAAVRVTVAALLAVMPVAPFEPYRGARGVFPGAWCEWGSIAIAFVLERRGLGDWTFVSNGRPDDPAGHAWLELRDDEGELLFTVDSTLHQFSAWDTPFIGRGATPARAKFSVPRYAGPWAGWPRIEVDFTYRAYAEQLWKHISAFD